MPEGLVKDSPDHRLVSIIWQPGLPQDLSHGVLEAFAGGGQSFVAV